MNFFTILIPIIFSFLISSCSDFTHHSHRKIATSSISVDQALSFKKANYQSNEEIKNPISFHVENYLNKFNVRYILSEELSDNIGFQIKLDAKKGNYDFDIFYSEDAFHNPQAVHSLTTFLANFKNSFSSKKLINNPYSIYEIYYNAKMGDIEAINALLKMRQFSDVSSFAHVFPISESELALETRREATLMQEKIMPELRQIEKERKKKKELRKSLLDVLDKASEDQQLKSLIAKNDRKSVVNLLTSYIPFEDMAPMEKRFWEEYLEILKNPAPMDKRIIIYRGLDEDIIQSAIVDGHSLTRDTAIKSGESFIMSSILAKNQGSWNRRLRSLDLMKEKYIGSVLNSPDKSPIAPITTMFFNHAIEPKGSPFLSFSPKIDIARSFGQERRGAFLIDPRILNLNFVSNFADEAEFLNLLFTFPDETIALWDKHYNNSEEDLIFFKKAFRKKIMKEFGDSHSEKIIQEIEENTKNFFSPVATFEDNKMNSQSIKPTKKLAEFYTNLASKTKITPPLFNTNGEINCNEIIKLFWNKK